MILFSQIKCFKSGTSYWYTEFRPQKVDNKNNMSFVSHVVLSSLSFKRLRTKFSGFISVLLNDINIFKWKVPRALIAYLNSNFNYENKSNEGSREKTCYVTDFEFSDFYVIW